MSLLTVKRGGGSYWMCVRRWRRADGERTLRKGQSDVSGEDEGSDYVSF